MPVSATFVAELLETAADVAAAPAPGVGASSAYLIAKTYFESGEYMRCAHYLKTRRMDAPDDAPDDDPGGVAAALRISGLFSGLFSGLGPHAGNELSRPLRARRARRSVPRQHGRGARGADGTNARLLAGT